MFSYHKHFLNPGLPCQLGLLLLLRGAEFTTAKYAFGDIDYFKLIILKKQKTRLAGVA